MKVHYLAASIMISLAMLLASADEGTTAAPVPPPEPTKVVERQSNGRKEVEKLYAAGNREVTLFHPDGKTPARVTNYNAADQITSVDEYHSNGKLLLSVVRDQKEQSTQMTLYNPQTGHKVMTTYASDRDRSETLYRPDGTKWASSSSGGCLVGMKQMKYWAKDGRSLNRMVSAKGMSVTVSDKTDRTLYSQSWRAEKGKYFLESVESYVKLNGGLGKRVVVMDKDGKTIDHVDYYKMAKVGWELDHTEKAGKLTETVNPEWLGELNPSDDPTSPQGQLHNLEPVRTPKKR